MKKKFIFPVLLLLALGLQGKSSQAQSTASDCQTNLSSCKSMALNLTKGSKSADCQASLDQCTKAKNSCKLDARSLNIALSYHLHTRNTCK